LRGSIKTSGNSGVGSKPIPAARVYPLQLNQYAHQKAAHALRPREIKRGK
jgi:hypothetical protein